MAVYRQAIADQGLVRSATVFYGGPHRNSGLRADSFCLIYISANSAEAAGGRHVVQVSAHKKEM